MSNIDRMKRRLLRDLVQQNVDLIAGRPPRRLRYGYRLGVALRVLTLGLVSVALFGSTQLLSTFEGEREEQTAAAARPTGVRMAALGAAPASTPLAISDTAVDATVFPLSVRRVAIDAGHGGRSVGTRTPSGQVEKDITLDIAGRLRKRLEREGFEVVATRTADTDVPLTQRGALANGAKADLFLSIHVNWIEDRGARGVETYYLGPTNDPYLTQLAASENRDSGYSLADVRRLLDRIYAGVRQDQSRHFAEEVQRALFRSLHRANPDLEDRGVKSAPFIVLLTTEMPAILAEVSCLSNQAEAELLAKPLYRQYIADSLADGVHAYAQAVEGSAPLAAAVAAAEPRSPAPTAPSPPHAGRAKKGR
jgi:N-acetylmuramoyl-L-alanine amidase